MFREVQVHEIREVLRLWLRGEGHRSIERLSLVDRNTVRRYIGAAVAAGWSAMAARVSSAMSCWATLEPDNGHPSYQGPKVLTSV